MPDVSYTSANHQKYTSGNAFYRRHLEAFMHRMYELLASTGAETVLDAGCGEGFAVEYLTRQRPGWQITGVDLSSDAIAYAQAQFGNRARFQTGSIYELPFPDDSFDAVLCSEVLEHLDDPDRAVAELKRVARHYVVITVPREPYFQWLNNIGQGLGLSPDPEHVNFWTKMSFQMFIHRHFEAPEFAWKHIYQLAKARV